jgi:hypothetical protein
MKLLAVCLLVLLGVLAQGYGGVDAQSQRQLDDLWGPQVCMCDSEKQRMCVSLCRVILIVHILYPNIQDVHL